VELQQVAGSYRDPSGYVFERDGEIFRAIANVGAPHFEASRDILSELAAEGRVVSFSEIDPTSIGLAREQWPFVLECSRLPFVSMPYEWSFSLLRDAALFHLDLHLDLLARGFTLSDASAYNVQFVGPNPIFIDHLSVRPYQDGEFWTGHRQFCEQFLNPLLLRAYLDIAPNSWYRGSLEGISILDLARLLPLRRKLSWKALSHIVLPSKFQSGSTSDKDANFSVQGRRFPLAGFVGMLRQLRRWISHLTPANVSKTTWANYAKTTTYSDDETSLKKNVVSKLVISSGAKSVIDLGCNSGDYSQVSLGGGATQVIGFDFDQQALDQAHQRAKADDLNFLPLYLDAKNPSPDQGWMQRERGGLAGRAKADLVLALAFEHHLAIAHNIPLDQVVNWIASIAPAGIIEFVPKTDPTVRKMLALREDIFPNYTEENFQAILSSHRKISGREQISSSGRTLYTFETPESSFKGTA